MRRPTTADTQGVKCFCGYASPHVRPERRRSTGELSPINLLCWRHHAEWMHDFVRPRERAAERDDIESNALTRAREVVESRFELFARDPKVVLARLGEFRPMRLPLARIAIDDMMRREPISLAAWYSGRMYLRKGLRSVQYRGP